MNRQWIGIGFACLVAGVLITRLFWRPNPYRDAQEARGLATRGLAEAVVASHSGSRALVLSNPFSQRSGTDRRIVEMEEAGLRGLRTAAGGKLEIGAVVYPELRPAALEDPRAVPIDPLTTTPLSYLVAADAFDHAAQAHPDCDVIVSLIGLPVELEKCAAWKVDGAPSFALLLPDLRMIGGAAQVQAAVKSGKLAAIVLRKPGGAPDSEAPGADFQAEFDRRYVLVTRQNVDEILQKQPSLLERP